MQHAGEDFHIPMRVKAKSPPRLDAIFIDDSEISKAVVSRIVIVPKRKSMVTVEPIELRVTSLFCRTSRHHRGSIFSAKVQMQKGPGPVSFVRETWHFFIQKGPGPVSFVTFWNFILKQNLRWTVPRKQRANPNAASLPPRDFKSNRRALKHKKETQLTEWTRREFKKPRIFSSVVSRIFWTASFE